MSAKMRGRVLSNGLEQLFRELRSMAYVSTDEIVNRARDYFKVQVSKSLELAFDIPRDPYLDVDVEATGAEQLASNFSKALKHQEFSASVRADALALLCSINPNAVTKSADALQYACTAILRAKIESTRILAAQLAGKYDETAPKDPWFAGIAAIDLPPIPGDEPKVSPSGPTFQKIAKQYYDFKSKNDWVPKTAADQQRVITLATELIGTEKAIALVDIEDVKLVRNALASLPPNYVKLVANKGLSAKQAMASNVSGKSLAVKTQDKYFTMFKQLFIWACNEEYIGKVPGPNVKVAGVKKIASGENRHPYSPEQLQLIFQSPVFTGHKSERVRHKSGEFQVRDGYFWVPLIALYAGMRSGEILQLLKADVKLQNGIYYFDISKGDEKSLKTASSKRKVPVHQMLIELGFLDYVASCPGGRIFPEIKKGKDGYASHNFSKWWGRYSNQIGFKSAKTAFHSFRHNFLDALRAAGLEDYINKALLGHSDNSVHGQYASGETLSQLKASIDKVGYQVNLNCLGKDATKSK
jgi:integrase